MISVPIKNSSGAEVGTYEFDPADLAPGVNRQLLHDVVVMYETNRRQGTVRTRSRARVAGSTKKLYRQKGTGRARAGPIRTPVRRGGGHTFAKTYKDWTYRLPKKAVRLATRMALLSKFQDGQAVVLDSLTIDEPKTKVVVGLLEALGVADVSCLLAIDGYDPVIWKSARNIPDLMVFPAAEMNAYQLLRQRQLVVTRSAIDRFLSGANGSAGEKAGVAEESGAS